MCCSKMTGSSLLRVRCAPIASLIPTAHYQYCSGGYGRMAPWSSLVVCCVLVFALLLYAKRTELQHQPVHPQQTANRMCNQSQRLEAIKLACSSTTALSRISDDPRPPELKFRVFLVDELHKILYCGIPKSGMTLWRTLFVKATGLLNTTSSINISDRKLLGSLGLKFLYHYSPEEQRDILTNYFKIMSVRHPMDRLISAYVDRFTKSYLDDSIVHNIRYINQTYRTDPHDKLLLLRGKMSQPTGVSLQEFLRLVVDPSAPGDIHWQHMYEICFPCDISYDHIIRQETTNDDAPIVLNKLSSGLANPLTLQPIHSHRKSSLSNQGFHKIIPEMQTVSKATLDQISMKYRGDMKLFGYTFDSVTSSAGCSFSFGENHCC